MELKVLNKEFYDRKERMGAARKEILWDKEGRGTGFLSNNNPSENISETGVDLMPAAEIMSMGGGSIYCYGRRNVTS